MTQAMVAAGEGIALLPRLMLQPTHSGVLIRPLSADVPIRRDLGASPTGAALFGSVLAVPGAPRPSTRPHTGDVVKISSLYDSWYASKCVGAKRVT